MIRLLVVLMFLVQNSFGAVVRGRVVDAKTHEPIVGGSLYIAGTKIAANTDRSGSYLIREVPVGRMILVATYVGYLTSSDTATIGSEADTLTVNVALHSGIWAYDFERLSHEYFSHDELSRLDSYHDSLALQNCLNVRIDSLYCKEEDPYEGEMFARVTVRNLTGLRINLLKHYDCMLRFSAVITDSKGDTSRIHAFFVDELFEKCVYDSSDIISLEPGESYQYPPSLLWLQSCSILRSGMYTVQVVYEYHLPQMFRGVREKPRKEQVLTYLKALRGTFPSENVWHLEVKNADR
jgi:CarboxypepD_reg-like domain